MSMIERVAKVIFEAGCKSSHSVCLPWEAQDERDLNNWREMARAAIAALREPTDKMLEYEVRLVQNDEYVGVDTMCATALWHAMIDAALSEATAK